MKRAVIYARFSCSKQREASIADQLRECRAWCDAHGYEVVAEYSDYAVSGLTDARPEFQAMIANAGESDIVLVYMMDRFSRDIYDAPIYKKALRDKGVKVVSATEALPDGPESMLLEAMYEAMAAMESAKNSTRTRRGMRGKALQALYTGDRVYGYHEDKDTGKYAITEDEAAIVREVFARRIAGASCNSIARDMAARGVKTYTGRPCSQTMITHMLKNPRYKGVYIWADVEIPDGMPAIITEDEWNMAQTVRTTKRRDRETWDNYALAGRAICACGANAVGVSGRNSLGKKYAYYRCARKCGVKAVPKEWLEDTVAHALRDMVSDRETALEIGRIVEEHAQGKQQQARVKALKGRINEAETALENIQRSIEQGIFTKKTGDRIKELEADKLAAETELIRLTAVTPSASDMADFLQFAATLNDAALVDAMVHSVVIGDDEIYAVLNYSTDGAPKTLSFAPYSEKERTPQGRDVRTNCGWLPICSVIRTGRYRLVARNGLIAVAISRAA